MATKGRKPVPKSQREVSNSLINPYDQTVGNPNNSLPSPKNRGYDTSFKGDNIKPLTLGIQDIDESIVYYFQNVIRPYVIQNGQRLEVPIIYGSPERWKAVQKDGYYRDKDGRIMSPIIMFKRNNLSKDRSMGNKLDANSPYNYGVFEKKYTSKDAYSQFDILNNRIPTKTYYATVIPDYVNIEYSVIIQTYYVDQLNHIVEAINYASDSYWGDPERFKFRARIDGFQTVNEVAQGENRTVRSNFNINLRGYLVPEVLQKSLNSISKYRSTSKIIFSIETTSNPALLEGNVDINPVLEGDAVIKVLTPEDLRQRELQRRIELEDQ